MKLWPVSYPKKCTYDDVRFFMLLCQGAEPTYAADIEIHVGASPFGFCKHLLGSGVFARSILQPLSLDKQVAHRSFSEEAAAIAQKGLKRHFSVKETPPKNWLQTLVIATKSLRFLKAFDAANTSFSAGWFQTKVQESAANPYNEIISKIEYLSASKILGYAYDSADPSKQLTLDFFINDTFVGSSQTDGMRRDIQEQAGGEGKCEFRHTVTLPRPLTARDELYLSIFDHETGALVCPAVEYPTVDIRYTSPMQDFHKKIQKLRNTNKAIAANLDTIQEALPALEQYAAFPLEHYDLYKKLYQIPKPPHVEGLLPNISVAKGPGYTYDPKADVIVFCDAGDHLLDGAIAWIEHATLTEPDAFLFFGNYEVLSPEGKLTPHYPTHFDLDQFLEDPTRACAYAVRRQQLEEVGGLNTDEAAPHAALWLRLLARHGEQGFLKLPHAAWHIGQQEPARVDTASLINDHFNHLENKATAKPNADKYGGALANAATIDWPIDESMPKLAIIIPTRNSHALIKGCVDSLRHTLHHPDATEIIIVDNGSTDKDTKDWLHAADAMDGIRVLVHDAPFNWAEINNKAVADSDADYFLFLNNDTVALDEGWDHILRGYLNRDEVGMVGARLLFEDGSIQFAGYVVNSDNIALKEAYGENPDVGGYMNRSKLTHACTALIGAFMACRRNVFEKANGYDAERFPVAFNDIDFCLTVGELGYKNLYVPSITFHHLESKSRGYDAQDAEKAKREENERKVMRDKWGPLLEDDPYYPSTFLKCEPTHSLLAAPKKASITT